MCAHRRKAQASKGVLLPNGAKAAILLLLCVGFPQIASPAHVVLKNATATFSQDPLGGCPCPPSQAIDGIITTGNPGIPNGWAIDHFPNNDPTQEFTTSETAVFQTVPDLGPSLLKFKMYFFDPNPHHLLGRFRLSVTTDDRSTYADGLPVGGNVTANWRALRDLSVEGPQEMTFSELADDSVLAGGIVAAQGLYEVSAVTNLSGITGIRLEALTDPSLPHGGGPGFAANGNFVLSEIQLDAAPVPEPAALLMALIGLAALGLALRRT
jgi:PEP-CTERM motif